MRGINFAVLLRAVVFAAVVAISYFGLTKTALSEWPDQCWEPGCCGPSLVYNQWSCQSLESEEICRHIGEEPKYVCSTTGTAWDFLDQCEANCLDGECEYRCPLSRWGRECKITEGSQTCDYPDPNTCTATIYAIKCESQSGVNDCNNSNSDGDVRDCWVLGPQPTPTPGGTPSCENNWWACSGTIVLGPYATQEDCAAPGHTNCTCGSPPCGWPQTADRAFVIFEDANDNGIWDSGEKRIDASGTCPADNAIYVPGIGLGVDGSSVVPNCNIGNSEVAGPYCSSEPHTCCGECGVNCNPGATFDCHLWASIQVNQQVSDSCFTRGSCAPWGGGPEEPGPCDCWSCNVQTVEGFVCRQNGAYCTGSGTGLDLKAGPVYKVSKDQGTYPVTVSLPVGWRVSTGTTQTRNVTWTQLHDRGACTDGLVSIGVLRVSDPPICTVSGATIQRAGASSTYSVTASDPDGDLWYSQLWHSPRSAPSWTKLEETSSGSYSTQYVCPPNVGGQHYITCNAYDIDGNRCTGNPWCEWLPTPPGGNLYNCSASGWVDCTANDVIELTCLHCTMSVSIPSTVDMYTNDTMSFISTPSFQPSGYSASSVAFSSSNTSIATVSPASDSTSPYETTITTGSVEGTAIITTSATSNGFSNLCSHAITVNVADPPLPECNVALRPVLIYPYLHDDTTRHKDIAVDIIGTPQNGTVDHVAFSVDDTSCATISGNVTDPSAPYASQVRAEMNPGCTTTVTAQVMMRNVQNTLMVGCSDTSQLEVLTPTCNLGMPPSLSSEVGVPVDLVLDSSTTTGWHQNSIASVTEAGVIERVNFSFDPTSLLVNPTTTTTEPFGTQVTPLVVGGPHIVGGGGLVQTVMVDPYEGCTAETQMIGLNPDAWWQLIHGGAEAAEGSIYTDIPMSCSLDPLCDVNSNYIMGSYPGLANCRSEFGCYGNFSNTQVSILNYVTESGYAGLDPLTNGPYTYNYFFRKVEGSDELNTGFSTNIVELSDFNGALGDIPYTEGLPSGFRIYYYDGEEGELIINNTSASAISNGRKVVVFADADVRIEGKIQLGDNSFFMLIVNGSITVSDTVGEVRDYPINLMGGSRKADIEGVYFAQNAFITQSNGTDDLQLFVRGSVAANGFAMNRDFADNASIPAEVFSFAPSQMILYPRFLSTPATSWREVAP